MKCDVIERGDLDAYVYGEASPEAARRVEVHLPGCMECTTELQALRAERQLFRARAEEAPVQELSFEAVLARAEEAPVEGSSFEAVLAQIDGLAEGDDTDLRHVSVARSLGTSIVSARGAERGRAQPTRAASLARPRSGVALAMAAVVAAAAAIGLWRVRGEVSSEGSTASGVAGDPESVAEPICKDDDAVARTPVSREPATSVDPILHPQPSDPLTRCAEERSDPETQEVCGSGGAPMSGACEDAEASCGAEP